MTRLLYKIFILIASGQLLMSGLAIAQSADTTAEKPPIAQPLVREGDFAVKLTEALKLGAVTSETEAESLLGSVDIQPRNGWIADYPVTPDIIGELQASVTESANTGKLTMGKDAALQATQDVTTGYNLSINTNASAQGSASPGTSSTQAPVINNYYYDEGPPVVTYYTPPPDYAYMYTWVPYPFLWWDFWYPGYFILVDFHVRGHGDHDGYISNHYRNISTGEMTRIDPANRSRGVTVAGRGGPGLSGPSARRGAQAILERSQERPLTGSSKVFRGYGELPPAGTRPSAFERSRNSRFERAASDRGFQSRSNAGRVSGGGRGASRRAPSRGQKSGPSGDGGFHGGGRHR